MGIRTGHSGGVGQLFEERRRFVVAAQCGETVRQPQSIGERLPGDHRTKARHPSHRVPVVPSPEAVVEVGQHPGHYGPRPDCGKHVVPDIDLRPGGGMDQLGTGRTVQSPAAGEGIDQQVRTIRIPHKEMPRHSDPFEGDSTASSDLDENDGE